MSWLTDVENKHVQVLQEEAAFRKKREAKFKTLDSMVRRLLIDVGDLLWGRSFLIKRNYVLKGSSINGYWEVETGSGSFSVRLCFEDGYSPDKPKGDRVFFLVHKHIGGGIIKSTDVSESALKAVIKEALDKW